MEDDFYESSDELPEIKDVDLTEFELAVLDAVGKAYSIRSHMVGNEYGIIGDVEIPTDMIAICMEKIGSIPTATQRAMIDRAMDKLMVTRCPIEIVTEEQVSVLDGTCVLCDVFEAVPLKPKRRYKYRIYTVYEKPLPCLSAEEREMMVRISSDDQETYEDEDDD